MVGVFLFLSGFAVLLMAALMALGWASDPERESFFLVVLLLFVGLGAFLVRTGRRIRMRARMVPPPLSAPLVPLPVMPSRSPEAAQVIRELLAVNAPDRPYQVVDGAGEGVDLIAEWKLVDAQWRDLAMKHNVQRTCKVYLKLDEAKREVRAVDREFSVSWSGGLPILGNPGGSGSVSAFRGQKMEWSYESAYRVEDVLKFLLKLFILKWDPPRSVYAYTFKSEELKQPLRDAVARSGWTYIPVVFGAL